MSKLISANFARLFKSVVFRLYMIFSVGMSAFIILMRYIDYHNNMEYYAKLPEEYHTIDGVAFVGMLYIIFAVSIFIGNFVGTEYSDGTIRNKLIVGHKRSNIYLANLVVCSAGSLMGAFAHILVNFTVGTALCGISSAVTVKQTAQIILYIAVTLIASTAIMVMITMLVKSKAGSSVSVLAMTMIMFFVMLILSNKLSESEYYNGMKYNPETQQLEEVHEKNPSYITGTKRKVYQAVYDAIPVSHLYEYAQYSSDNAKKYICYDGAWLVVTTALGIVLFRKKDLK
ncbi:MAG: ABC transporter permease [Ruminococcus flavefaciens]|nr:ABC transporter permease [Ruminococcus flavefaciens]